jgi:tetratricopeptide (TPR) repeat protein
VQPSPETAESNLARALRCYREGKPGEARRLCEQVLTTRRNHAPAHRLLAVVALEAGDATAAIGHLRIVLASEPNDARAHASLGRALVRVGKPDEAAAHFQRATGLDPEIVEPYLALAQIHLARHRFDTAAAVLRDALARDPTHAGVLNNLGSILVQHGDAAEGLSLLERVVALNDLMPVAHYNLANALKRIGKADQAVAHYQKAAELQPSLFGAWHNLGNVLLDLGRVDEAAEAYDAAFRIKRRPGGPERPRDNFRKTSRSKLEHDIEQLEYLIGREILPSDAEVLVGHYRAALANLPETPRETHMVEVPSENLARLAPTYNRLVQLTEAPALAGPAVNPVLDRAAIEADYQRNIPGFTHLDGFLTAEALDALRRFCLESTIWYQFRYANGYLGAFMDDGFCCPLLLQIAEEMRRALPGIFRHHTLRKLWAFKYDSRLDGIPIHADFAAVNVNFWITPDDANRDPAAGGLIFWDKEAPLDWDFETYNADVPAIRAFLKESRARAVNVPHRQNRVVIFNSDLFHETGKIDFRGGYENRRINITMLFGKRGE